MRPTRTVDIWRTGYAQVLLVRVDFFSPSSQQPDDQGLKKEKGVINSRRDSGEGENSAEEKKKKKRKKRLRCREEEEVEEV